MRLAILCLLAFALSPSVTQAQASAGVPVIKITKEDSSIKFNVKTSVAIDGTFDMWDATITMTSPDVESAVLESYGQLQQDGKLQRAVRERMVAGLSTRNYRRAVESVLEGYGIEKSSASRQFMAASSNQLRANDDWRI